jgi:bifunctional DNA-binding transcriptional regulator/antitoxin component of YhaV-PrlF toxin-antitoxin module
VLSVEAGADIATVPVTTAIGLSYALPLMSKVKGQTKVSSKHQVTIPVDALRDARLQSGDVLRVEADGAGRVVLTRLDELLDRYSGCIAGGGRLREAVDGLRDEWR